METPTKFTQEIKDNWLKNLKSGQFIQGQFYLENNGRHCCIGVLGCTIEGLDNNLDVDELNLTNPYNFLIKTIGERALMELYVANDKEGLIKPDYSNVIPLIEALPVQE